MTQSRSPGFKCFLACTAFLVGMSAQAEVIIVPNSLAAVEGNSNNGFPFNIYFHNVSSMRYQQAFNSSEFSALSGPSLLTQIAFRPDDATGNAFSSTLPNIQINLSTTSGSPDTLSTTFATNVGSDDLIVFSGALMLSSADTAGPGTTRVFDIVINLSTPFLYDPSLGDLLLDVRNFEAGFTTPFDAHTVPLDSISRVLSGDVNSPTGGSDSLGLVAQFTFQVQEVPEPAGLALIAIALAGLGWSRRRQHPA